MADKVRRMGLTNKVSIAASVPMAVVIAIMGIVTVVFVNSSVDGLAERTSRNTLQIVNQLVEAEFATSVNAYLRAKAETTRELMAWYDRQIAAGVLTDAEARAAFTAVMLDPQFGRVGTTGYMAGVTPRGILAIHPLSQGVDASGHAFMQEAMRMRNGYLEYEWQNVGETATRTKAGYLAYYEPWDIMVWASSYKSEFLTLIDAQALNRLISEVRVAESGYVLLVRADGTVASGQDRLNVLPTLARTPAVAAHTPVQPTATGTESSGTATTTATAVDASSAAATITITTDAGRTRIDTVSLASVDWSIVVVTPLEVFDRLVRTLSILMVASILFAAFGIHFVIRVLVARNLSPITTMKVVVDEVTAGDLTGSVTVVNDDEIGDIAVLFNRLIGEFSRVLAKIKSVISVLGESVQNLSTSTQEIASTSNEQAAAVKEVLSTMEDADRLSKGVETKVQEVARIATNTRENVEKGFTLIQTSLTKMDEIRSTNTDTITGIKTLGDRIESIWDIVNIINGIADQTKIIAFNAELEAAAAGDAGKNFQIVAGEIRRLADGTVNSTNEIKVKINEIQHASDKLIIASEQGTQRIREGWEVSTNIRGIFEDVLSSSEVSATSAGEISRSMRMQVSSFEQIFLTLKQISESIDSFVESTAHTTEVADQLTSINESFRANVEAYKITDGPAIAAGR